MDSDDNLMTQHLGVLKTKQNILKSIKYASTPIQTAESLTIFKKQLKNSVST